MFSCFFNIYLCSSFCILCTIHKQNLKSHLHNVCIVFFIVFFWLLFEKVEKYCSKKYRATCLDQFSLSYITLYIYILFYLNLLLVRVFVVVVVVWYRFRDKKQAQVETLEGKQIYTSQDTLGIYRT